MDAEGGRGFRSWLAPFEPRIRDEIGKFLADAFLGPWDWWEGRWIRPPIDVMERDNNVVVLAELAGYDPKDVEVSVSENAISISGKQQEETDADKRAYHQRERRMGMFRRTVSLPVEVDPDAAKAKYRNGLLEISVPKKKPSKVRSIQIEPEVQ